MSLGTWIATLLSEANSFNFMRDGDLKAFSTALVTPPPHSFITHGGEPFWTLVLLGTGFMERGKAWVQTSPVSVAQQAKSVLSDCIHLFPNLSILYLFLWLFIVFRVIIDSHEWHKLMSLSMTFPFTPRLYLTPSNFSLLASYWVEWDGISG